MPRHVAFLRGVSPMNAKMPDLKRCFEHAGFTDVRTVLSSGNVVFDASSSSLGAIERKAEAAMRDVLGRSFYTVVRSSACLRDLLASNPFAAHDIPVGAKRVVSFLREPRAPKVSLPLTEGHATVLCMMGREVFTAYVATDQGPVFMKLIAAAFGADVTTRTWDTVAKCASV